MMRLRRFESALFIVRSLSLSLNILANTPDRKSLLSEIKQPCTRRTKVQTSRYVMSTLVMLAISFTLCVIRARIHWTHECTVRK